MLCNMWQMEWPLGHMLCHLNMVYCVNMYGWQIKTTTVADVKPPVMNHKGRYYDKVAGGILLFCIAFILCVGELVLLEQEVAN